ncbi:MAG: hypothetical protein GDA37_10780 [Ekhidna sp.]|nr:hypothetical protein [Ekhidna sp.]
MKYKNIREEELKNKIAQDHFWIYDCTKIIGNVDFCVSMHQSDPELSGQESLLWAEAKKGTSNIYHSMVQLILTIGKARTFDDFLPPPFLGAFDGKKIAFIPYSDIHEIFYRNDFNWNVTPSNYETKEFKTVLERVTSILDAKTLLFDYQRDEKELKRFIKSNFIVGKFGLTKTRIDKNNFMVIYNKWLISVKPSIGVNWDIAKKNGIVDGDFYLADLLSENNKTLKDNLYVILKKTEYELDRKFNDMGMFSSQKTSFNDKQKAHTTFWNKYERPPKEEYWDYIVERRDLLVPQDVRERKGSYFTPQIWVELSQKYLTDVLGEDWQDEYYVWDCAAGTGNLLHGLTNKYHIWASTLDRQDVEVMKDRIKNGANLLEEHVFRFDFLNDDFSKLPQPLQNIINDPKKRKKLVVYINPPYAEATSSKTVSRTGSNKSGVATGSKLNHFFNEKIGNASNEIFALFMARVYEEIPNSTLALFSKMKFINGTNFRKFKSWFSASYLKGFVAPSFSFDNVKGRFPIGFTIWNLKENGAIKKVKTDVFNETGKQIGSKVFYGDLPESINKWLTNFYYTNGDLDIGTLSTRGNDFQNQKYIYLATKIDNNVHDTKVKLSSSNLIQICIYFSVRHVIETTWLNDRDQFLHPNEGWKGDKAFQNDCLAFTLFHGQNRISSKQGTNHWIPFTEQEVNAREKFESNFMTQFVKGKTQADGSGIDLFSVVLEPKPEYGDRSLKFSKEASEVFDAGRALWKYYHQQPKCNVNASLYDIREHFQGRNDSGKMHGKSDDSTYTELITELRSKLKLLAAKITPKIYKYGFLKD